ncbi:flagellin [Fulvimarina endophytica]|uniref:Flagellin n=2 Tax=Fulvimarina endophytica TaxID=2293836 RepID=A0A371X0D0_9HYPH|nr:flagellin [Fulvimarina endophytica]
MDAFTGPMQLTGDANIAFKIDLTTGASGAETTATKDVKITKATISAALGTTDGKINSASEFQQVMIQALKDPDGNGDAATFVNAAGATVAAGAGTAGEPITGITVGSLGSGAVSFTFDTATNGTEKIAIKDIKATADSAEPQAGTEAMISVAEIDISKAGLKARGVETSADIKEVLTAYVNIVDAAIENVTSAASTLGSVSSRIDMQQDFLSKLNNTIEKGIGTLVDADMTEESTRLKALQTQQQLGVQSLSMANNSSQSLLSLFR